MAERRMFSRNLLISDQFLDLSMEAQALYFHICLSADDDGFVTRAKGLLRMVGARMDALEELVGQNFLIAFEGGTYVIRHWRMHNAIRKDRYTPTTCMQEMGRLELAPDGSYMLKQMGQDTQRASDDTSSTGCQSGIQSATQEREEKVRADQDRKEGEMLPPACTMDARNENDLERPPEIPDVCEKKLSGQKSRDVGSCRLAKHPSLNEVQIYARERQSCVSPERFYDYYESMGWQRGSNRISDWKAAFRCWESRERDKSGNCQQEKIRILPIQQYSQRTYDNGEESVDDMMVRLCANNRQKTGS